MYIILIGPPGSGKGTQSNLIYNQLNINKISLGDILRNYKNNKIQKIINKGNLVSSKLIYYLLKKYIKNKKKKIIIDGFPKNREQIIIIKKLKLKIILAIELFLDFKTIKDRLLGRIIHLSSGRTYHKIYNPPLIKNIDNITNEKLIKRLDDNYSTIKKRYNEYLKELNYLREYFISNNILYKKINGKLSINNINNIIKKLILNT